MSQLLHEPIPGPTAPPPVTKPWYQRLTLIVPLTVALVAAVVAVVYLTVRPRSSPTPSQSTAPAVTTSPPTTPAPSPTTAPGPGTTIVSSRVAYPWQWPGGTVTVPHNVSVPPVPKLVAIGAGDHPNDPGERPYNRITFTFTNAFPSYDISVADTLVADATGQPVPIDGLGVEKIAFRPAQAHTDDGTASTITTQPARHFGYLRIVDYAQAGDNEGVLTYGIGIAWPIPQSNPQIPTRVYEVEKVTATGQHLYVVAIDIDARQPTSDTNIFASPMTVHPGHTVGISGVAVTTGDRSCPSSGTLTITSDAAMFPPDGFGPQPSRDSTGAFHTNYTVPTTTPAGTYTIGLRCDGGNMGVNATLRVAGD